MCMIRTMRADNVWCRLDCLCTTGATRNRQAWWLLGDVPKTWPVHSWCLLSDVHRSRPMRLSTTTVFWRTPLRVGRCLLLEEGRTWLMLVAISQRLCHPDDMYMQWFILSSIGQHLISKAHLPLMTLLDIGRCNGRPANAHTPWPMCAGLGWCCIAMPKVAYLMCTCHFRCVQALGDAPFHW